MDANKPQLAPHRNGNRAVWDLVIEDMQQRHAMGIEKYGTPLQAMNGRDSLVDAYQEVLDLAVYLRQQIEERDERMFECFKIAYLLHCEVISGKSQCSPDIQERLHLLFGRTDAGH